MKKNLIIGAFSGYSWPDIAPWCKSIDRCGFKGDKIMVVYNASYDTVLKLFDNGFQVIVFNKDEENKVVYYNSPIRVHVERFIHIYQYLREHAQDYDYVVTTDVRDIIFQTDPTKWVAEHLGDKQLIVGGEGIRVKDEVWNDENVLQTYGPLLHSLFREFEACNVGTLGGKAEAMRDLALNLYSAGVNRQIPIVDQAVLNGMVHVPPYNGIAKIVSVNESWACQCGVNVVAEKVEEYKGKLMHPSPLFDNGVIRTPSGEPYSIVHQYDRVPEWKRYFLDQYKD